MAETVPKVATLDGFADTVAKNEGIGLQELGAGKVLIVETDNGTYTIEVLNPAERTVRVVGGEHFPNPEICILSGSTFGGSMLKMGWIGMGMHMEFHRPNAELANRRVTTSPVIAVSVSVPGAPSNYVH